MSHPFSVGVPIPDILFTPLQAALRLKIKTLAKDIAATLGESEEPLLAELLKGASVTPYILEEEDSKDSDARCDFLCVHPESPAIIQKCGEPILWSSRPGVKPRRCAAHAFARATIPLPGIVALQKVEDQELYRAEDGTVYDGKGEPVGCMYGSKFIRVKKKSEA